MCGVIFSLCCVLFFSPCAVGCELLPVLCGVLCFLCCVVCYFFLCCVCVEVLLLLLSRFWWMVRVTDPGVLVGSGLRKIRSDLVSPSRFKSWNKVLFIYYVNYISEENGTGEFNEVKIKDHRPNYSVLGKNQSEQDPVLFFLIVFSSWTSDPDSGFYGGSEL